MPFPQEPEPPTRNRCKQSFFPPCSTSPTSPNRKWNTEHGSHRRLLSPTLCGPQYRRAKVRRPHRSPALRLDSSQVLVALRSRRHQHPPANRNHLRHPLAFQPRSHRLRAEAKQEKRLPLLWHHLKTPLPQGLHSIHPRASPERLPLSRQRHRRLLWVEVWKREPSPHRNRRRIADRLPTFFHHPDRARRFFGVSYPPLETLAFWKNALAAGWNERGEFVSARSRTACDVSRPPGLCTSFRTPGTPPADRMNPHGVGVFFRNAGMRVRSWLDEITLHRKVQESANEIEGDA